MKPKKKNFLGNYLCKELVLLFIGGIIYMGIELLWRGYTHWTMGIVGGLCFVFIGILNEGYTFQQYMEVQAFCSAIMVTVVEFISGLILNVYFKLDVWDYSNLPFNLGGQICLLFTIVWFFLAFVAIYVDDLIRHKLFGESFPDYRWLIRKLKQ